MSWADALLYVVELAGVIWLLVAHLRVDGPRVVAGTLAFVLAVAIRETGVADTWLGLAGIAAFMGCVVYVISGG